ncbi:MAG: hypothetical protein KAR19_17105 [Bacteroidales bacterium]|nr:hypothetical protein [Bacteroidales bacterium]
MRRKQYTYALVTVLVTVLLATGCKSGNRGTPALIDDLELGTTEGGLESFNQIYHLYPSPAEMLSIIDMTEMSFDGNLLNPVGQADKYLDTKSRTSMLGVYMTDLAYAALFGRHEATLDYLEVVRSLSEEIRIEKAIDDEMIEKARTNVEYLDSLYNISNEAFMNILAFCERNERSNTVVMLSAGAFTESLFLAVNLVEDYEHADHLLQHLADQKYTIDNFMMFAENVKEDDPNVAATIEDLKKIKKIYDGINPGSGEVSINAARDTGENQPKKLVIGGSGSESQPSLSQEEFENLKVAVTELRTKIIEG